MKKFLIFLIILAMIGGGVYYFLFREVSSDVLSSEYNDLRFVSEGDLMDKDTAGVLEGQVYLSLDYIKENLDPDIFYDEKDKTVVITTSTQVKRYKLNEFTGSVNDVTVNLRAPVIEENDNIMLPIEVFIYDYPVDLKYLSDKKLIVLNRKDKEYLTGKIVVNNSILREGPSSESPKISELPSDTEVIVYGETDKWYKVREVEGKSGYIKKSHLELSHEFKGFSKNLDIKKREAKEKINLVWDYTSIRTQNADNVTNLVGVNVISPTWFSIRDESLAIDDRSNLEYVKAYQSIGKKVWPMFDNNFKASLTEHALSTSDNRQKIIKSVFDKCMYLGVDGINVDFENINISDRDNFTQFVRELYPIFKEAGMTVSVDVTPRIFEDVTKEQYDRKRLADAADYIMLMAYDQHWSTSPKAGSVAEYKWVESNMNVLFRSIPMEKFILGMPLYTRIWFDNGERVTSQSVGMAEANNYIENNLINLEWDNQAKQNYGSKTISGNLVSVWLEDPYSLREKTSLATKYNLAGVASWRKGFETSNVWPVIDEALE